MDHDEEYRIINSGYDIYRLESFAKFESYMLYMERNRWQHKRFYNEMHALFLKKAHTATENSLRIGALTGRGNVTGHAIILNHDYDYTRTTQVIHTNQQQAISAEKLPTLESKTQDIVLPDIPANFENL